LSTCDGHPCPGRCRSASLDSLQEKLGDVDIQVPQLHCPSSELTSKPQEEKSFLLVVELEPICTTEDAPFWAPLPTLCLPGQSGNLELFSKSDLL
jgi:hypothetical protein